MLISAAQQSDSVIHTYIYIYIYIHILSHILFHYGLLQYIEYTSCATQKDLVVYPMSI